VVPMVVPTALILWAEAELTMSPVDMSAAMAFRLVVVTAAAGHADPGRRGVGGRRPCSAECRARAAGVPRFPHVQVSGYRQHEQVCRGPPRNI